MTAATKNLSRWLVKGALNMTGFAVKHMGISWLGLKAQSYFGKIAGILGLEAIAQFSSGFTGKAWEETAPIVEEFATPIVDKAFGWGFEILHKEGKINLAAFAPQVAPTWHWNLSDAFSGITNWVAQQPQFISNYWTSWWNPTTPGFVTQALETAREIAPNAGEGVANGMQYVWDYGMYPPIKLVGALSELTGYSAPIILLGSATTLAGLLGLYLLMRPSAKATATAIATGGNAVAHGGAVNFFFTPAVPGAPIQAAAIQPQPQPPLQGAPVPQVAAAIQPPPPPPPPGNVAQVPVMVAAPGAAVAAVAPAPAGGWACNIL